MSSSKKFLLQQKLQNTTILLKEQANQNNKNFNKIATLEPYMADIQVNLSQKHKKKLKFKNKLSKTNKNKLNQSSSRSFRIKDISSSSLHKLNFDRIDIYKTNKLQKNKETIHTTGLLNNPNKIKPHNINEPFMRERKAKSQQQRPFQSSFSKTINTREAINLTNLQAQKQAKDQRQLKIYPQQSTQKVSNNNTFNDYFLRNTKNKDSKQQKFRKNMYEIVLPKKNSVTSNGKNDSESIRKISRTQLNIQKASTKKGSQQQIDFLNVKRTQIVRKNNFRRGKYQVALHSSVNENTQPTIQNSHDPLRSQRLHNQGNGEQTLTKKDSTLSINRQMDILAEKEMIKFYQKVRTREIQKSLQKSTEKYFGNDSYRPIKSKNQIQIYISSIINPSINKISQSTYDKESRNKSPIDMKHKTDFLSYDFDFQPSEHLDTKQKFHEVIQNSQEYDESLSHLNDDHFAQQRRQAERNYYEKVNNNIQWSDQDCQVDDI